MSKRLPLCPPEDKGQVPKLRVPLSQSCDSLKFGPLLHVPRRCQHRILLHAPIGSSSSTTLPLSEPQSEAVYFEGWDDVGEGVRDQDSNKPWKRLGT